MRKVLVLGSTGSIGRQTLDVIARSPERFRVVGLAAGRRGDDLAEQARRFGVRDVALADDSCACSVDGSVRRGVGSAEELVRTVEADIVVASIVGSAGLASTLAALELGRDVALANKETLVAAGALAVATAQKTGARLLPVDSEHSGVWQCLEGWPAPPLVAASSVRRVTLTASGGALRGASDEAYYQAGPEEALAHPTWDMGAKVTVDCATLMNKALELIEAHWLFGVRNDRLGVLMHPESIVHASVEMEDGSVLAQLGTTDMRTAIQAALTWPERAPAPAERLDLAALGSLTFARPDEDRHLALRLARRVIDEGGLSGAVLTAANEEAVGAFLDGHLPLGRVPELAAAALDALDTSGEPTSLDRVMEADRAAREFVGSAVHAGRAAGR